MCLAIGLITNCPIAKVNTFDGEKLLECDPYQSNCSLPSFPHLEASKRMLAEARNGITPSGKQGDIWHLIAATWPLCPFYLAT